MEEVYSQSEVLSLAPKAPDNGDDAVTYFISPSLSAVHVDADGMPEQAVTVNAYKRVGGGNAVRMAAGDGQLLMTAYAKGGGAFSSKGSGNAAAASPSPLTLTFSTTGEPSDGQARAVSHFVIALTVGGETACAPVTIPVVYDGRAGDGIELMGSFDTLEELTAGGDSSKTGNTYLVDGHIYTWDGSRWKDNGNVRGEQGRPGTSSYIHYAWANSPDGSADFSVSKLAGMAYAYMGICVNSSAGDPGGDSAWLAYEWNEVRGGAGRGIASTLTEYLATTLQTGVTRETEGDWVEGRMPAATESLPYIWKCVTFSYTEGPDTRTCELIYSFTPGVNANLLRQTDFTGDYLSEWTGDTGSYYWTGDGEDDYPGYERQRGSAVPNAVAGHGAWFDECLLGTDLVTGRWVLEQQVTGLTAGGWLTLSFLCSGAGNMRVSLSGCEAAMLDGVQAASSAVTVTLTQTYTRHTLTARLQPSANATWASFFLLATGGAVVSGVQCYICMPKLEYGMMATAYVSSAAQLRRGSPRVRPWQTGGWRYEGAPGEPYTDICVVQVSANAKAMLVCKKTHLAAADNEPYRGNYWRTYWEQGEWWPSFAADILAAVQAYIEELVVGQLLTTATEDGAYAQLDGSALQFFGNAGVANIRIGIDENGMAAIKWYDNSGTLRRISSVMNDQTYALDGATTRQVFGESWVVWTGELVDGDTTLTPMKGRMSTYYQYISGGTMEPSGEKTYSDVGHHNRIYMTAKTGDGATDDPAVKFGDPVADGWYVNRQSSPYRRVPIYEYEAVGEEGELRRVVSGYKQLYVMYAFRLSSGRITATRPVYFCRDDFWADADVLCDADGNLAAGDSTHIEQYLNV